MKEFLKKFKGVKPADILHIFLFLFALPIALVYRLKRKDLWLVCDNGVEAADNGYWFFKYVREAHPEQDCVFAVHKTSVDYERVASLGKTVEYSSFMHWILYLTAKVNISSQKGGKPNFAVCYLLEVYGIIHNNRVFLQHGITVHDVEFLHYDVTKMSMFVTAAQREQDFICANFGYPEGSVRLLGFTRFDNLHSFKVVPGQILLMPTWREWLGTNSLSKDIESEKKRFVESDYYKHWSAVINSSRLEEICEKYGCRVLFYPHRDTQRFISCFKTSNPHVTICEFGKYNVQQLLMSSAFMVTDHSSVQLDFAYMKKPLAYYQFDEEMYWAHHHKRGYFDDARDGFGPVFAQADELMEYIEKRAAAGFVNEEKYLERHKAFFTLYDTDNSKRNYEAIKERWG